MKRFKMGLSIAAMAMATVTPNIKAQVAVNATPVQVGAGTHFKSTKDDETIELHENGRAVVVSGAARFSRKWTFEGDTLKLIDEPPAQGLLVGWYDPSRFEARDIKEGLGSSFFEAATKGCQNNDGRKRVCEKDKLEAWEKLAHNPQATCLLTDLGYGVFGGLKSINLIADDGRTFEARELAGGQYIASPGEALSIRRIDLVTENQLNGRNEVISVETDAPCSGIHMLAPNMVPGEWKKITTWYRLVDGALIEQVGRDSVPTIFKMN